MNYSSWQDYIDPLVEHFEQFGTNFKNGISKPYVCSAGRLTVGIGHQIFDNESAKYLNGVKVADAKRMLLDKNKAQFLGTLKGLTVAECEELLNHDLTHYSTEVQKALTKPATPCQFAAMVSLCFNIGVDAFKSCSVKRLFNEGKNAEAAKWFSPWCHDDKKQVQKGLSRRRKCESLMFQGWNPDRLASMHWFIQEFK